MTGLRRIRIRTIAWSLSFPLLLLGVIPWWLHHHLERAVPWRGTVLQWLGIWLLLNGIGLAGWCVNLFNVEGGGTPVPFDPPKRFVVRGPYQYVRNPMALGMVLALAGEAALYRSSAVLLYLLAVIGLLLAYVRFVEEPQLLRRFGASYTAYQRQVPPWIPQLISNAQPRKPR